ILTNGVASFQVLLKTAGTQTITATDTVTATLKASQATIVTAAPPAGVDIEVQPSDATAGKPIRPAVIVWVVDAYGNRVPDSHALVTLALASGPSGAVLGGET